MGLSRLISKRRVVGFATLGVASAAVTLALATGALAVFPDDNVTHFTGCLNTAGGAAGTFSQVAVGDSPAKACNSNQTTAHLSGGDVTSVSAGSGLTGGGTEGAVSLAVDSTQVQTRISGDCASSPGQAIKQINQDGTVACSAGPSAFFQHDLNAKGSVPDDFDVIGSLALPAGKFLVTGNVTIKQEADFSTAPYIDVTCFLTDGSDVPGSAEYAAEELDGLRPGSTLTMVGPLTLTAPGTVSMKCIDDGDSLLYADMEWRDLVISAIKVED
jgi:hypothetical protein